MYWVKKKTCLSCFRIEEIRDKDNETGLQEGGGIELSTTVLPLYTRCSALFRFVNTYQQFVNLNDVLKMLYLYPTLHDPNRSTKQLSFFLLAPVYDPRQKHQTIHFSQQHIHHAIHWLTIATQRPRVSKVPFPKVVLPKKM